MTYQELKDYPTADKKQREALDKYIGNIPDSQTRDMFVLHFCQGLSYKQTADRLGGGMSRECVYSRIRRYIKGR